MIFFSQCYAVKIENKIIIPKKIGEFLKYKKYPVTFNYNAFCPEILVEQYDPTVTSKSLKSLVESKCHKGTVIMFWATYCRYCKQQMKDFDAFSSKHPKIKCIIINLKDQSPLEKILKMYNSLCPNLSKKGFIQDATRESFKNLVSDQEVRGIPFYVFFDNKGKICAKSVSGIDWENEGEEISQRTFS